MTDELNISGGRTSGYMLWHILQAYGGQLPANVHAVFTNTGREFPQTLDFLAAMSLWWGVEIVWIERRFDEIGFERVSHNSASRNGEPFDTLIDKRRYLPNGVTRFCTIELKIRAAASYMRSLGYGRWCSVVGFRYDERARLVRAKKRDKLGKDPWYTLAPMVDARVSKRDVAAFWKAQPFDLRLPNVNGKTPLGNCDLCFLKGAATLAGIARDFPERARWWVAAEDRAHAFGAKAVSFRPPKKITHTAIVDMVSRQDDMVKALPDVRSKISCYCTGD